MPRIISAQNPKIIHTFAVSSIQFNSNDMQTATIQARKTSGGATARKTAEQPKRLSKFAEWRKEHPHGILEVVDWRAVNR
jgi:hypothetical protein